MKKLTQKALRLAIPAIIAGMALTSCVEKDSPVTPVPVVKATGIDIKNLDKSVNPTTDFYRYANGGWMKNNPLPTVDGLTADERFFLANAGVWAQNITEAEIRRRTMTDVHSLGEWRVNGAFPHIDAWYDVYGVKEGDKMYLPKEKRLELW